MSVPTGKRSENKLQALADMTKAVEYLTRLCNNESVFAKKTRWNLCQRLMDEGLACLSDVRKANSIRVTSRELAVLRLGLQESAILHVEGIWTVLDIAARVHPIPMDKLGNVSCYLDEAEKSLRSWHRADAKRYSQYMT